MPDDELSWFRRYARREPLIVRSLITYGVAGAAYLAARYLGVELDTEAVVLLLLSVVGLAAGVAREGVYSPATVAKVAKRAGEEALLAAPHPPADSAPTATVLEVVGGDATTTTLGGGGGSTIGNLPPLEDLDWVVAALKKQGAEPLVEPAPPAPTPARPEPKPPAGLYAPDESISETDGPTVATGASWIPWAPTRQPPPPGLDG